MSATVSDTVSPFDSEWSSEFGVGASAATPPPPPPPPPQPPPGPPPPPPVLPYSIPPLPPSSVGNVSDFMSRLRAALPRGWFAHAATPSDTPVMDGILTGFATIWSNLWQMFRYISLQKRIATATDINLDIISTDYLGTTLPRRSGEGDDSYRARIRATIFQPKATRKALSDALAQLTGAPPDIFEPRNPADTGGWGTAGRAINTNLGYGVAGGYGSYNLPFQAFIRTNLPPNSELQAGVQGYLAAGKPTNIAIGGYGSGAIEYTLGAVESLAIVDAEIFGTINSIKPVATIMWVSTSGTNAQTGGSGGGGGGSPVPPPAPKLDSTFILDMSRLASGTVTALPPPPTTPVVVPPPVHVPGLFGGGTTTPPPPATPPRPPQ